MYDLSLLLQVNQVKNREFVLVLITANFSVCHPPNYKQLQKIQPPNSTGKICVGVVWVWLCVYIYRNPVPNEMQYAQDVTIKITKLQPSESHSHVTF